MTNLYRLSNVAPTSLTNSCGATGSITVVSNVGLPTTRFPYKMLIDWGSFLGGATQEAVYVTGVPTGSAGAWTLPCIRGVDGTGPSANTGTTHLAGAPVMIGITQEDFNATEWINATLYPYGADPTGTIDSTAAINSALAAAYNTRPGLPVYLPTGVYVTSAPIQVPPGGVLMGDYADEMTTYQDALYGTTIQPSASWAATTIGLNTLSGVITVLGQAVQSPPYATASVDSKVFGVHVDCHLGGAGITGVQCFGGTTRPYFGHVEVSYCSGNGFDFVNDSNGNGPGAPRLFRCTVRNATGIGFNIIKISDATAIDCLAETCTGDGWHLQNLSNGLLMACRGEHNGASGVGNGFTWICSSQSTGSGGFQMIGCKSDRNEGYGLACSSSNSTGLPLTVSGEFRRDGRNGNSGGGNLAGVYVNAFPGTVILDGVSVWPGVDDNGTGTPSPAFGLKIASNAGGYITGAPVSFQGATADVSDDGTSAMVALYGTGASGPTTAPVIHPLGHTVAAELIRRTLSV